VTVWQYTAIAAGVAALLYVAFVVTLAVSGRREHARAVAGFVPDCAVLFSRLMCDARVSRRHKLMLGALVPYLAMPFDLVPDFIPVAGQLDDALLVVFVLRRVLRAGGPELVREHWPGPSTSLDLLLRVARVPGV